jgi:hypothetical protein
MLAPLVLALPLVGAAAETTVIIIEGTDKPAKVDKGATIRISETSIAGSDIRAEVTGGKLVSESNIRVVENGSRSPATPPRNG